MNNKIICSNCKSPKEKDRPCLGCFIKDLQRKKGNDENGKTR